VAEEEAPSSQLSPPCSTSGARGGAAEGLKPPTQHQGAQAQPERRAASVAL
jgi:hypothetical protein